jgi:hypothetical protein
MWTKTLSAMLAASMIAGCATGMQTRSTPECSFDQELLNPTPPNLPAATAADLGTLRQNREDSKEAYKRAHNRHRDLAQEVRNCMAAQDPQAPRARSALDERVDRLKGRLK